ALRRHLVAGPHKHAEVLPLYSRLSQGEQERVFDPSSGRRVVLATNVAETSLTVPGVRYVIDSGLARVKRYSYRNKIEQLQVEPVSQASANQRAGRCGRVADGVCIRLYDEKDYAERPRYTDPEILRSSLAAVILRMKSIGLGDIEQFPFLEPPRSKAIADGLALLTELGAIDDRRTLTPLGRELAALPLDPRIGRMILEARERESLSEVLVIASALSVQDPRERPLDAQEAADNAHRRFADERSEFIAWLKLWQHYHERVAHKKSHSKLHQQLKSEFLSPLRLREWHDVHSQLAATVGEHGWRLNTREATYEQLHCALLAGLLGNVGMKDDEAPHYLGARGIKFYLHPGSALAKKAGRWVMAAEITETTRLYARTLARIEPQWLERLGGHLLQRVLSEPHWDARSGKVLAYERATLYGLPVYHGRRVDFAQREPQEARQLFIREALVAGDWQTPWPFLANNLKLVRKIEELEHKARRQDVLVDDELIAAFYSEHLPDTVVGAASFDAWYRDAVRAQPKLLFLSRDELMRHEAAGITTEAFPKSLRVAGLDLALSYVFEPGSPKDGVTVTVPLYALNQLPEQRLDWLVPGLLKEKVLALLKSLPQKPRARLVPLPEFAQQFVDGVAFGEGPLLDALRAAVRHKTQLDLRASDFKLDALPAHLLFNLRVVAADGHQLGTGRSLARLRAELGEEARGAFQALAG
ncbi:MAG: ATP-dependent RNA helicase HrpA, partial [Betaproteobacteria bacterium]|nr:ATP-dependent RNA helicase HrpA [Betaproteobacteria bacterium]